MSLIVRRFCKAGTHYLNIIIIIIIIVIIVERFNVA